MFIEHYDLSRNKPAPYNPRRITEQQFAELRRSIREIGVVRPIIVCRTANPDEDTTIAGHQRSKAMRAEGLRVAPAHLLDDVNETDEIAFNQLHNATDVELAGAAIRVAPFPGGVVAENTWVEVPADRIESNARPRAAAQVKEICGLLSRYGPWGGSVALADGTIIGGHLYAYGCLTLGLPLHVCYVPEARRAAIEHFLSGEYGQFSYDHLPRNTWVQSLKQPFRLRGDMAPSEVGRKHAKSAAGGGTGSRMWSQEVLPRVSKRQRILDFGAGQKDYVERLTAEGYDVRGVEFYHRKPGSLELDYEEIQRDIDRVCDELRTHGLYDVVVCDSVINSVDTVLAERDVFATVGALCRPGGFVCLTGHAREGHDARELRASKVTTTAVEAHFYDADGFTAVFDRGVWSYQKYHTEAEARALGERYFTPALTYSKSGAWFGVRGRQAVRLPQAEAEASLYREFELPYPDGSRVGRGRDIVLAYRAALAKAGLPVDHDLPIDYAVPLTREEAAAAAALQREGAREVGATLPPATSDAEAS